MDERAHGGPAGRGAIRSRPEDFRVVEQLGYEPSGSGEHLWLEVEKRGLNTIDVAVRLAERAGVPVRAVGFAGLKDRNALTRQPFTVQLPGIDDPDVSSWSEDDMSIVRATRHQRKIQRGQLAGNRFELVVTELDADRPRLEERLRRIAERGVPNGFGEQRFGGNNIARAYRLFRGELRRSPSRRKRGFYLSAARSLIFNRVLAARIGDETWDRVLDGERVMLDGTRSTFAVECVDDEIELRARKLDLHPTGPLVGQGETGVGGRAAELESEVADSHRELVEGLVRFGLEADRRPLRMRVLGLEWSFNGNERLVLSFELRAGCYATAVLRELLEYRDASHDL
jgi:tRNA pseudouridine13 synthase